MRVRFFSVVQIPIKHSSLHLTTRSSAHEATAERATDPLSPCEITLRIPRNS